MVFLSPRSASLYQLPDLVRNKDLFAYTNKEATEIVLCPVCTCVPHLPLKLNCCNSIICDACLWTWTLKKNSCVYCRSPLKNTGISPCSKIIELISQLEVSCLINNCEWVGKKSVFSSHIKESHQNVCNNRSSSKKSETLVPRRAKSAHVRNVQFRRIGSNDTLKVQRDEKICHMVNPRSTSILYSHAVSKKLSFYKNTNNRLLRLKNLSPRSTSLTLAIPKSPILISDKSNCSQNSRNLSNRNVSLNCHLRQRPSILRTSTRNNYFRSFSPIRTTSLGCNFKQEKSFYNFTSEARSYPNSNPICQILPERTTSLQCIYDNLCDEFVNAKGSVKNKDDDILSIERVRGSSSNSGK